MKHTIRRTALAVISGIALVATAVGAEEHELERILEHVETLGGMHGEKPREMQGEPQEEWQGQGQQEQEQEQEKQHQQGEAGQQQEHEPQGHPQGEQERDRHRDQDQGQYRDRDRDDRPDLMRAPGLSAEERARDGLRTRERPPVPWVDHGPETDVDVQIEAVDRLMPADDLGVVARELDGHEYCGSGCGGAIKPYKRVGNPNQYFVTCHRTKKRCTQNCGECGCVVYNSPKGGTERSYYREGTKSGKIQLDSAKEAYGNDWYCYCVED